MLDKNKCSKTLAKNNKRPEKSQMLAKNGTKKANQKSQSKMVVRRQNVPNDWQKAKKANMVNRLNL